MRYLLCALAEFILASAVCGVTFAEEPDHVIEAIPESNLCEAYRGCAANCSANIYRIRPDGSRGELLQRSSCTTFAEEVLAFVPSLALSAMPGESLVLAVMERAHYFYHVAERLERQSDCAGCLNQCGTLVDRCLRARWGTQHTDRQENHLDGVQPTPRRTPQGIDPNTLLGGVPTKQAPPSKNPLPLVDGQTLTGRPLRQDPLLNSNAPIQNQMLNQLAQNAGQNNLNGPVQQAPQVGRLLTEDEDECGTFTARSSYESPSGQTINSPAHLTPYANTRCPANTYCCRGRTDAWKPNSRNRGYCIRAGLINFSWFGSNYTRVCVSYPSPRSSYDNTLDSD
jgi:hypothetical protein